MATLNDFKLLGLKCLKYFDLLSKSTPPKNKITDNTSKERFGFYVFMLDAICNLKDISDIVEIITDQDFNTTFFKINDEDHGVDAVFIDEENNIISLFNFKYRERFSAEKKQSLNETLISTKFATALATENVQGLKGKLKAYAEQIIEKLNSKEIWKLKLYVISNDSKQLETNQPELIRLQELYDLESIPMGLESITKLMSIRPSPVNAIIHIDKDAVLPYAESSLSSSKSYIIKLSASDLIRITCDNSDTRDNYQMEDYSVLSKSEMEFNLLFDNVRGLIVRSKFNRNIFDTLRDEPSKFFMYNNGLTIIAKDVVSEDTNANKKIKIEIKNFQVVNGGQTLRTLHKFNQEESNNITNYLSNCELLIRVFKTSNTNNLENKIAEYTNSQNAISIIDLKSLSLEQIQIEQFLDEHNIVYARKAGDTGITPDKTYTHKISMEKFGQMLFSIQGSPERASNQKRQIFDKYYDEIFNRGKFDVSKSAELVMKYFQIRNEYEKTSYPVTDQKIFYLLYVDSVMDGDLSSKIYTFENILSKYQPGTPTTENRKLLHIRFKEFLDLELTTNPVAKKVKTSKKKLKS